MSSSFVQYLSTLSPLQLSHLRTEFRERNDAGVRMMPPPFTFPDGGLSKALVADIEDEQAERVKFADELADFGTDSLEEYARTLAIQVHASTLPDLVRSRAGMQLGMVREAIAALR